MKINKDIIFLYRSVIAILFYSSIVIGQNVTKLSRLETNKDLYLISPKGTETFEENGKLKIVWDSQGIDKILIEYSIDDIKWNKISSEVKATNGKFIWKIASKIKRQFKIRITDIEDKTIFDITPFYLGIKPFTCNKKTIQFELNKTSIVSNLRIMPLGNSITEGYTIPIPANKNGYRKPLKEKLDNNGLSFDFVGTLTDGSFTDNEHEGHGGWHAKHWRGNLNYDLLSHLRSYLEANPPDIILLHIGTNDIGEYYKSGNDNTVDTTVADVSSMLDTIYTFDPTIKVVLAKIINREDNLDSPSINETIETTAYNNVLEIMVNNRIANGDNLSIVDMEPVLTYPDDLSDGVHPDGIGYEKMSVAWYNAVINILPQLTTKIFLEGSYISSELMNISLNNSNVIPHSQPFNQAPWNYTGTENVNTIPSDVVDWILVSLRTNISEASTITQRAGFLKSNGSIVDLDGVSPLPFTVNDGNYYIVIEHRNHLPVMSAGMEFID